MTCKSLAIPIRGDRHSVREREREAGDVYSILVPTFKQQ